MYIIVFTSVEKNRFFSRWFTILRYLSPEVSLHKSDTPCHLVHVVVVCTLCEFAQSVILRTGMYRFDVVLCAKVRCKQSSYSTLN